MFSYNIEILISFIMFVNFQQACPKCKLKKTGGLACFMFVQQVKSLVSFPQNS